MKGAKTGDESGEISRREVTEGLKYQVRSLPGSPKSLRDSSSSRAQSLTALPASPAVRVAPQKPATCDPLSLPLSAD